MPFREWGDEQDAVVKIQRQMQTVSGLDGWDLSFLVDGDVAGGTSDQHNTTLLLFLDSHVASVPTGI